MKEAITIHPLGNDALLVELEQRIDPVTLDKVLMITNKVEKQNIGGVAEVVPAYASFSVHYNPLDISYTTLKESIEQMLNGMDFLDHKITHFLWEIPVCYELGINTKEFAAEKKLAHQEIIDIHTKPEYLVYMRGFVPGFLYLGGLDERLYMQRKSTPTLKVPPGSVAIGGQQTGIYALPGPAGWHVIGQTPVKLFDPDHKDIMPIKPGDKVKFKSIAKEEFEILNKEPLVEKKPFYD